MNQYKHEVIGGLFGLALINLWYFSGLAIEEEVLPKHYDYFFNAVTVTFSTALGAYLAFRYNASIERHKREVSIAENQVVEIAKLNRALFNLGRQLNSIGNMNLVLSKYSNEYDLAFNMRVEKNFDSTPMVDFDELTLILSEELPMLLVLDNEQAGFLMTLESFQVRSDFFINRLQPEMAEKGLLDRKVTLEELHEKLSYGTYKGAIQSATIFKDNVEKTSAGLEKAFADLLVACKNKYPKARFIDVE
ncbi:hypothetical protein GNP81_16420 [Aliivibrio fischeri]|uniref:hypothetical protein n=1 Tax=Aliivibrio fischeri TaxID=668 RepID=UPI0012D9F65F|nr:hypothetical protein [Aliivibrio fischeri]MUK62708.1 hypothetical protein [Aliivibrio fischeri]MUL22392.1 hypothetical protein [Aliivibrio fischeri]MUL26183.1 hypothetical protein [Aliivibrio fischeri]